MFKNYFIITVRFLIKRKSYALLNLISLFIGMTSCLLIFQYVSYERSYDTFENKPQQIVRLRLDEYSLGKLMSQSATVYPIFGPGLKREMPEVEDFCRLSHSRLTLSNDERNAKFKEENGYYADASVISMFNLKLINGNPVNALDAPGEMLLSEKTAQKYFGSTNPMGKRLIYRHAKYTLNFIVTGVFKDFPPNSHLSVSHLASYSTLYTIAHIYGDTTNMMETSITLADFYTYLQLKPNADISKLQAKLPAFCDRNINNTTWAKANKTDDEVYTIPLKQIHLYSHSIEEARINGDANTVDFILLIGFFIVGIAWINYINFATVSSAERGREVGMRKALGAKKADIIFQFMLESLVLNATALVICYPVAYFLAPLFNQLMGEDVSSFSMTSQFWLGFAIIFISGTTLSGIYPGFVLLSYKPLSVLKGAFKHSSGGILLRKSLMAFQFSIGIFLISATIIIYEQVNFMRNHNLGADISRILILTGAQSVTDSTYQNIFEPFKVELMSDRSIKNVAASYFIMGQENFWTSSIKELSGNRPDVTAYTCPVDYNYVPLYQIKLIAGRNFSKKGGTDQNAVILNNKCLPLIGFRSPQDAINHKIIRNDQDTLTIIGVVQNFHNEGLQKPIQPQIMILRPNTRWYYSIKLEPSEGNRIINEIEKSWTKYFPNDPFNYFFLDEYFDRQYKPEIQFGKMFNLFALIAIIIACAGLFGLSSYNILQRNKEISIRKVLGASTKQIIYLLSKDFIILILISFLLGVPVTLWSMHNWLQSFSYRIDIPLTIFLMAGFLLAAIAIATIGFQVVKTSLAKPAKNLRSE